MILYPPAKIGVLGGGQLGRLLCKEASRYGYMLQVYNPKSGSPTGLAGGTEFIGEFSDLQKLEEFLDSIEGLTFEFENIPVPTLDFISDYSTKTGLFVSPGPEAILVSNHRIREKNFFKKIGIPTTKFIPIIGMNPNLAELSNFQFPAILKTNQMGYDGKGQRVFSDKQEFLDSLEKDRIYDHILEEVFPFDFEVSVIGGRMRNGFIALYPPSKNIHKHNILDITIHPADLNDSIREKVEFFTRELLEKLEYVGVLGLEFFVKDEKVLANEFAPRPHNSGHYTLDGANFSQFEIQLFALTGIVEKFDLKTESTIMKNIVGKEFFLNKNNFTYFASNPNYKLHMYQKEEILEGRKLGHINFKGEYNPDLFNF